MRTRNSDFFDTKNNKQMYSIQLYDTIKKKWIYAGNDQGIYLFENSEDRDVKRAGIRKRFHGKMFSEVAVSEAYK